MSKFQVGQTVTRTTRGLTSAQATVVITEIGLVARDNRGKARPAVRGVQPAFADQGAKLWLENEIAATPGDK
jgi:hypothetical protein